MLSKNVHFVMDSFYNLTGLPIRYYTGNSLIRMLPDVPSFIDPAVPMQQQLLPKQQAVYYRVTDEIMFYGVISEENGGGVFVVGPGFHMKPSAGHLSRTMINSAIARQYSEEFTAFINCIPVITFENFLSALCFLHFALNQKRLAAESLLLSGNKFQRFEPDIRSNLSEMLYEADGEPPVHDTYNLERQIIYYVRSGSTDKLNDLFENTVRARAGTMSKDALRQEKNIFISTATLVTRAAIEGGLDVEMAYHLSDLYIQQAESLTRLDLLSLLRQQMVLDCAKRVEENKYPADVSSLTESCIRLIRKRMNTAILVRELARELGVSVSYLSRIFKRDLGVSLNDYINREKIEESKCLLAFSGKPLSEISSYLCFSSQSYFQNLFKSETGLTPLKYRNAMHHQE
ncbi:helix-turn-helix domain-containing protein [Paenibacillus sp. FSL H7-0350]|uniref:helix-turn-helix domain-containing protein n=1 Tax=Paenibacillus sp. FSL H7-0350 TaxID=2975345 RepID=UPI003158781B